MRKRLIKVITLSYIGVVISFMFMATIDKYYTIKDNNGRTTNG